jgi:hypothetical protein
MTRLGNSTTLSYRRAITSWISVGALLSRGQLSIDVAPGEGLIWGATNHTDYYLHGYGTLDLLADAFLSLGPTDRKGLGLFLPVEVGIGQYSATWAVNFHDSRFLDSAFYGRKDLTDLAFYFSWTILHYEPSDGPPMIYALGARLHLARLPYPFGMETENQQGEEDGLILTKIRLPIIPGGSFIPYGEVSFTIGVKF